MELSHSASPPPSSFLSIALVGGGPSALFFLQELCKLSESANIRITIFETSRDFGIGTPYSSRGAQPEHVTNVSSNEIPALPTPLLEWLKGRSDEELLEFQLKREQLHQYLVIPRLLFGQYLHEQFTHIVSAALKKEIDVILKPLSKVVDVRPLGDSGIRIEEEDGRLSDFDSVIICSGHLKLSRQDDGQGGVYRTPYPPKKLARVFNHPVALRGSSLTAFDAMMTLARANGSFRGEGRTLEYMPSRTSEAFRIDMYSRDGFFPCVRCYLDDPRLRYAPLLTQDELEAHRRGQEGFISLDFLFEREFKQRFIHDDPGFYEFIRKMSLEEFIAAMMKVRIDTDPFRLLMMEYEEAERSIREEDSIDWKEKLAILSLAVDRPAKYLSAEDRLRLETSLLPLISLVIAFVPQTTCEEVLALHKAGRLTLTATTLNSKVSPKAGGGICYSWQDANGHPIEREYHTYVDCIGQPALEIGAIPFASLRPHLQPARLRFRALPAHLNTQLRGRVEQVGKDFMLRVPGVAINDDFQAIDHDGLVMRNLFVMAVSLMGGFHPDYSGLDFCEQASQRIVRAIAKQSYSTAQTP